MHEMSARVRVGCRLCMELGRTGKNVAGVSSAAPAAWLATNLKRRRESFACRWIVHAQ